MNTLFSTLSTFEEFEKYKLQSEVLESMAKAIIHRHQLPEGPLSLFQEGTNIVFSYGDKRVIKIFPAIHYQQFKNEQLVLHRLHNKLSVPTPAIEFKGEIAGWTYMIMNRLEGTLLETLWDKLDDHNKIILVRELGLLIQEVHSLPTQGLEEIDCHWQQFIDKQINQCVETHRSNKLPAKLLPQLPAYIAAAKNLVYPIEKPVILTGEYTPMNLLVKQTAGIWHICGLIDFGDAMLGLADYDLLGPVAFLIQGNKELLKEFLAAYGYSPLQMNSVFNQKMMALMLLHQYSNLNVQIRISNWQEKVESIRELENLVWGF